MEGQQVGFRLGRAACVLLGGEFVCLTLFASLLGEAAAFDMTLLELLDHADLAFCLGHSHATSVDLLLDLLAVARQMLRLRAEHQLVAAGGEDLLGVGRLLRERFAAIDRGLADRLLQVEALLL